MNESRGDSPDWLREFEAPSMSHMSISSASESSPESSPKGSKHSPESSEVNKKKQDSILIDSGEESPVNKFKKMKAFKVETDQNLSQDTAISNAVGEVPCEGDVKEKLTGYSISSRLPLVFPEKVQRSKALVECDGDSIELSGDVGAVGRVVIANDASGNHEMLLDLKGTMYKSTIVPSRTFCVVSIGQSEAKIEAIMNDFIQLEPQSNVFEAETMIEGTLDGFLFDSDEETDKIPKPSVHQNDHNNENGDLMNSRPKRRKEKEAINRKPKATGRPVKSGARKPQVAKKRKSNK